MGVLNHLDHFRHSKSLKRTKKTLKTRLQTEIHAGAKLFYLSGMMYGTVSLLTHACIAKHLLLAPAPPLTRHVPLHTTTST